MNYRYKVTLRQQLTLLFPMIVLYIGLIIGGYLLAFRFDRLAVVITFLFFFFIDTLPTIIVHVQYWIKNHDAVLILDTGTKELSYESKKQHLKYSFSYICSLQYYRPYGKGSGWHSFGQYRYYKIIFNDKTELNITCLMINDIENTIEMLLRMKAEKHFKLVCVI